LSSKAAMKHSRYMRRLDTSGACIIMVLICNRLEAAAPRHCNNRRQYNAV